MNKFSEAESILMFQADGILSPAQIKTLMPKRTIISIECFWKKYEGKQLGSLNGLPFDLVEHFDPLCPYLWSEARGGYKICLWVDLSIRAHLFPKEIQSSIQIMADIQKWIFKADDKTVRDKICQIWSQGLKQPPLKKNRKKKS